MTNDLKLTQEKWNVVLDLKDQLTKQQDELDKLRRISRALLDKNTQLEAKLLKVNTNAAFNDIFKG